MIRDATGKMTEGLARRIGLVRGRLRGAPRTRIRPNARLTVERGGVLDVEGSLDLGVTHAGGRHYPGEMVIRSGGTVRVRGSWAVATDHRIWVADGAVLALGSGGANYGLEIVCNHAITIGEECLLGYRVTIRDSDEHEITGGSGPAPVHIGNRVLIATGVTILPGVTIGDGAVVAAGSIVTRDVPGRTLVAGSPARVIREDVDWS